MGEEKLIDLLAEALLSSDTINYIVKIQSGKGLQVETNEKRHYNILIRRYRPFKRTYYKNKA